MKTDKCTTYATRDDLLKLLSHDELASVSLAETMAVLAEGEEFIDLERLDKGVLRAQGKTAQTGRVLPKKAVHQATWNKFLAHLAPVHTAGSPRTP